MTEQQIDVINKLDLIKQAVEEDSDPGFMYCVLVVQPLDEENRSKSGAFTCRCATNIPSPILNQVLIQQIK